MGTAAWAQTHAVVQAPAAGVAAEADVGTLDTVVIKGERIDRSLRETAASVSHLDSEDLDERVNSAGLQDVMANMSNVVFADSVGAPIIRGQDTQGPTSGAYAFLSGTIPRATVNLDGRYLSYNELVYGATSVWDVKSVEVWRGPQTTSQGANSIAGAMVVHTKDPTFEREGAARIEAGSKNTRRVSAMLSGPLAGNELAARLALDHSSRDTFIQYVNPRFAKGASDQDFQALDARLKLLYEPKALPGLRAKLTLSHVGSNRPTSESASEPYEQLQNRGGSMPSFEQKSNSMVADVSYDMGNNLRLSNTLQYTRLHVERMTEPLTLGFADIRQKNFSNDLRLNWGKSSQPLSGVAGIYYGRTSSDELLLIRGSSTFDDEKKSLGVYAEVSQRLGRQWLLTGGLRWQRDSINRSGSTVYSRQPVAYSKTFSAVLPKLSLAWDATPGVTVGALVSKGYNPGGTGVSFSSASYYQFGEETAWNYELFTRASLLGGRLHLSGNLFHTRHKDAQRQLPDYLNGMPYGSLVVNADKARSSGLEFSADWLPADTVRLRAGVGLLNTRIQRYSNGGAALEGNDFGRAPQHTASLAVDWQVTPSLKAAAQVRSVGRYHSTDENLPLYRIPAHTVVNLQLGYQLTRAVQLYAWANNVFDKRSPIWKVADRSVGGSGIVASMLGPRMLGVGLRAAF